VNAFELRKTQIVWRINLFWTVGIDRNNLDCKLLNNSIAESGGQKGTWICRHCDITGPPVALGAWKLSLKMEGTNDNLINQQMLKNCRKWIEDKLTKQKNAV
jgi:hypothetical protein